MRKPFSCLLAAGIFAALPLAAQAPSMSDERQRGKDSGREQTRKRLTHGVISP